jgi:hypothetical protein
MTAPHNQGKPWTSELVDALMNDFTARMTLRELCEKHGRTPSGILSQLERRGLVVALRTGYHRIDPDPWVLHSEAMSLTKEMR